MTDDRDDLNFLGALGLLTVGAVIGAAAALLLAPRTGDETRELLRGEGLGPGESKPGSVARNWARRAQETVGEGADRLRAQEYFGRGREAVEDTFGPA